MSSDPDGLTLVVKIRLVIFTAASARPLLCGYPTDEVQWETFQDCKKVLTSCELKGGPPSVEISSGTPKLVKYCLSIVMIVDADASGLVAATSVHLKNRSA